MNVELKDICSFQEGYVNPAQTHNEYFDGNIKWIRATDINGTYIYNTSRTLTEEGFNSAGKSAKLFEPNTLIISKSGTIGKLGILKDYMCGNRAVINIKPDLSRVTLMYLYYSVKLKLDYIKGLARGSVQKNLYIFMLEKVKIYLPDVEIQKKMIKYLENVDKKIELNNKINNNLYEISKQLLLKYLDENKSSDEINISKFLNIFTGKKNANETSPTGKYKFFSCAPESLLSDTYLCDSAAIIVAGNGAYTGRTRFYDGKFELYQRTYGLTLKDGLEKNNIYGLYVFMKTIFEPDKMGGTHGSAIPYIVLSDLTDYKLKYNKVEFDRFSNLVSGNIKMIQENEKSNEKLSELRDTLLPKLMNGEIDLDNIEI